MHTIEKRLYYKQNKCRKSQMKEFSFLINLKQNLDETFLSTLVNWTN